MDKLKACDGCKLFMACLNIDHRPPCASDTAVATPFASNNSRVMQLLCDIKTLLLDVDTPTREQRSDIVHRIAQLP
jgi:hypothetical protein